MRQRQELQNKCRICGNLFCCEKCRRKHEENKHAEDIKRFEDLIAACSFCRGEALLLQPAGMPKSLLKHIVDKHFPLYCKKCAKVYVSEIDLQDGKCTAFSAACKVESTVSITIDSPSQIERISTLSSQKMQLITASTQTTPGLIQLDINRNEAVVTPTFAVPAAQQAAHKQKLLPNEASIAEGASSLTNLSSFSTSAQIATTQAPAVKLVRTTSTPMLAAKPRDQHFDSSSGHVSSIHGSSSDSDVSSPPDGYHMASSPGSSKITGKMQRPRGRGKLPVSATPLRQVMSKSIQRAIAEHGAIGQRDIELQPKKIFSSMNSSYSLTSPLDLRTSPVLRRTQSEVVDRSSTYEEFQTSRTSSRKHIFSSSRRVITEDVIISSISVNEKLETVYESCRSFESSNACFSNENVVKKSTTKIENVLHVTPKCSGVALKKTISFDTPDCVRSKEDVSEEDDVFYTPTKGAIRRSLTCPSSNSNATELSNADHFSIPLKATMSSPIYSSAIENDNKENDQRGSGNRLWSLVSSVMRLASFGDNNNRKEENATDGDGAIGIIKRCASFAGVLARNPSKDEDYNRQQIKRKRTNTFDAHSVATSGTSNDGNSFEAPSKRMRRIQGRKPIERMRNYSRQPL